MLFISKKEIKANKAMMKSRIDSIRRDTEKIRIEFNYEYEQLLAKYPKGKRFKYLSVDMVSIYIDKLIDQIRNDLYVYIERPQLVAEYFGDGRFNTKRFNLDDICLLDK